MTNRTLQQDLIGTLSCRNQTALVYLVMNSPLTFAIHSVVALGYFRTPALPCELMQFVLAQQLYCFQALQVTVINASNGGVAIATTRMTVRTA